MIQRLLRLVCDHRVGTRRERDDDGSYWLVCLRCGEREQVKHLPYQPLKPEGVPVRGAK